MTTTYANIQITKVLFRRGNTIQNDRYTGIYGEITVNTENQTLRLHDGLTLGGFPIGFGSSSYNDANVASYLAANPQPGTYTNANVASYLAANPQPGTYTNANVQAYLTNFDGNVIPSADATYSLGTISSGWKNLFVDNSVYIGGIPVSIDGGNNLVVNGSVVGGNANVSQLWYEGYTLSIASHTGQTTFPTGFKVYGDGTYHNTIAPKNYANLEIQTFSSYSGSAQYYWIFNTLGELILPTTPSPSANTFVSPSKPVKFNVNDYIWTLGTDGILTAPAGAIGAIEGPGMFMSANIAQGSFYTGIGLSNTNNLGYVSVNGVGGTAAETWINSMTGSDDYYWVFGATGNTYLATNDVGMSSLQIAGNLEIRNSYANTWAFDTNGGFKFPDNTVQYTAATYSNVNVANYLAGVGTQTFGGNVVIQGNLYVSNIVSVTPVSITASSPLLYLESNVTYPYNYDIGLYSQFTGGTTGYQHTGLVRDFNDSIWKLFSNVTTEPNSTVDFTNAVYDSLQLGNVLPSAIYTNNYYYANGAPLLPTQISAFSNDVGYITTANLTGYATTTDVSNANLAMKGYVDSVANNTSYGNSNVASYLLANPQGSTYSNSNVASYLPTYSGNVNAAYYFGNGSQISGLTLRYSLGDVNISSPTNGQVLKYDSAFGHWTNAADATGAGGTGIALTDLSVVINDASPVNGGNLSYNSGTGVFTYTPSTGSTFSNSNVAAYLTSYNYITTANLSGYATTTDVSNANVAMKGYVDSVANLSSYSNANVTAYLTSSNIGPYANANVTSYLTSIGVGPYANANVIAYLTVNSIGPYSNANVAAYLPVYGGNVLAANVTITGDPGTGVYALDVGVLNTHLSNAMANFAANVNSYAQFDIQNMSSGSSATSDYVATSNTGNDSTNYVDLGIANNGYNNAAPSNSLGNVIFANDSYLYAQGNTSATVGGNLAIGTTTASKTVKIFAGGINSNSIIATVSNTGVSVTGNVSTTVDVVAAGNVWAQGGYFRTSAATAYIVNQTPTTVYLAGAATIGTYIGNASGVTQLYGNVQGSTNGFAIGYRDIPQVTFTGNTTITLSDAGKHYYSTSSTNYTLTVANNATQSFSIGAAINVVNRGTGTITIAAAGGVSLYLAGNSTSGSRTISSYGMATLQKVETDVWFIVGVGIA